jgi:hypothetical protein
MAYLGLPQEKSAPESPEFPTETTLSYEITPEKEAQLQDLQAERQQQQEARSLIVEPTDYTKLSGQQNRGIAKGVQMVIGDSAELYSVPAATKEDLFARGFLDNSGEPTSKGRLAVTLIKKGVLNPDFTLTEDGKFFSMKESDYFSPDNKEAFLTSSYGADVQNNPEALARMNMWKKAEELGLHVKEQEQAAKDMSFGDTAVEKGRGLIGMVSNAGKMLQAAARVAVGSELPFMDTAGLESPEVEAKVRTRLAGGEESFVETAATSLMNQVAWVSSKANNLLVKAGLQTEQQANTQNTFNKYQAASLENFLGKTNTVAELSSAIGLDDAANQLAASEQLLGKEQFGKIKAEGAEVGAFLGDITNIEISPLMKAFGMVAGGGSKLLNSVVNAKRINEVKKITALTAESSLYEARATEAAAKARLATRETITSSELEGVSRTYGDMTQSIAHAANKASWGKQAAEATAQAERNAAMSQTLRETANGLENTLPPTFQSQIINAGKLPVALPLKAVGFAAKKFGDTLASVDRGASSFLETFGLDKYRGLARAASIFTGNVNPLSIAEGVVASNKLWNGAGRLLDSVGENMLVNQGTVPFFRRVADDMATPWGKTFATQLDNFVPPVARGVGAISKGIAGAAAPSLVYEAINHQGLDANVFKQAATDALVFGGVHGVFKAATVGGARDFNAVKAGDRANFNERLKTADPEQYDIYNSKVDPSTKDLISSFSGAYPNAKIKFVTEGPSYQSGNTATFNVNAPREHAGVIALHELKHVLQNEFQLDEAILAHMVGNKTRGGEIFTKDGSLDPEFVKFSNEYNNRIKALGQPELGVHDLAIEFYTDKAAEVLKSDIKSGEFTKRAQESQLSRTVKSHFSSLVNQVPIIKNIHIKTGGAIDSSGRLVKGSGLLSEGFTQSKDVQAMVRKLYRETAGVSKPVVSVAQEGATMRQPRATKSTREGINNGTSAIEKVNRESRAAGLEVPEGALDPSTVRGRDGVPTALQTKAIIDSGAIHPDHLGTFPMLVGEMNPSSTSTFLFHYRPAEQGRTTQSAAGETFHHIKPVGVRTNKKGNVLITALDVNLWDQNIKKVANSKPAKDLGYTEKQIRADSYEASKYHIKNQSPDAYFEQKYGKAQALKRKSLVASTYGEMTAKQRAYNPLLSEVGMGRPDHVYRTFSLDDVKSATRTNSSVNLSFDPNNYYSLKVNLMPEAPIVDRSGNIIENPAMKDFFENHLPNGQRFRENAMPESKVLQGIPTPTRLEGSARYMPEPLSPKTYANQKGYDATEILSSKLDDNGKIILTRPISPKGALPLLRDRRQITKEIPAEARNQFAYDDIAKVSLYKNNGSDVYFNFDPNTQVKPVFKDAAAELAGKNVQIAMADRATAANGDMGGILFPNLKVNQITFTGGDGVKYRPVWANMGWKPVSSMKTKAIDQGSVNLMTYIMGKDAHASNIRTARTVSNEIENAGLSKVHKDLLTTLASHGDMLATNASHAKTIKKHTVKVSDLWVQYRNPRKFIESKNPSPSEVTAFKAKTKKEILKLTKLAKDAKTKVVEIPSEFKALLPFIRSYRNASTRFANGNGSLANKNARLNDLETYMKSSGFKKLSANYSGRQLIDISSTFDGRKAAVDATTGLEFEGFSTDKVIESLGEFDGATNNQVLGSVELSSNPDLFAIYLGNDPKQIKFMSESEKLAAKHYKEHPDFVQHEAYEWVMLGPENGNHFLNSNPQKLVDYFSDFGDKYEQATGKRPQTENSSVGAMRDGLGVVLQMPETTQQ